MTDKVLIALYKIAAEDQALQEAGEQSSGQPETTAAPAALTPAEQMAKQRLEQQKQISQQRAAQDPDKDVKQIGRAARYSRTIRSKLARYSKGAVGKSTG